MATKRIPRPRDPIALAKLIGDIAAGQVVDAVEDGKDAAAVVRGKLGGKSDGQFVEWGNPLVSFHIRCHVRGFFQLAVMMVPDAGSKGERSEI